MKQLDLFYKAFLEYKKNTKANLECQKFQTQSQGLNKADQESLDAIFTTCTIDEDWIEAIEHGIPYMLKAIKEERQFIRNDGEVTPIEKVRKTSKYSIQDLARHSNYISHENDKEDLDVDVVPDKLLIVKKENDYTVYENRVVYATLLYLQEFISFRLAKIKEATNKYEANSVINKKIVIGNRTLNYDLKFNEVIKDDPIAAGQNNYKKLIERIEIIYSNVLSLIRMPLMVEVSKVDLVSRPITKTNVLKMDLNFKETLNLFDFISEYPKPGFQVTTVKKSFNPLALETVSDFTETMMLTSFITYMHVNGLKGTLAKRYQDALDAQKDVDANKILEKIKKFNIKAKLDKKTLDEYLVVLDEACSVLEERNKSLNKKIEELKVEHEKEIGLINERYENRIQFIEESHHSEICKMHEDNDNALDELSSGNNENVASLRKKIQELTEKLEDADKNTENAVLAVKNEYQDKINKMNDDFIKKYEEVRDEKEKATAEILAIKLENGFQTDPENFSSQERFNELQREKKYIDALYKKAWKKARVSIWKQVFSVKPSKDEGSLKSIFAPVTKLFGKKTEEVKETDSTTTNNLDEEKRILDEKDHILHEEIVEEQKVDLNDDLSVKTDNDTVNDVLEGVSNSNKTDENVVNETNIEPSVELEPTKEPDTTPKVTETDLKSEENEALKSEEKEVKKVASKPKKTTTTTKKTTKSTTKKKETK